MKLQFSHWEIDTDARRLHVAGELVAVEPRVFDLLALLASNPNKIFSRDELLENVWCDRVVSDTAISSAIKSARKAIGDDGQKQAFIQTVHGRGFRFIGQALSKQSSVDGAEEAQKLDPVLIVLPFKKLSGNIAEAKLRRLAFKIESILLRVPLLKISSEGSRFQNDTPSARKIYEEVGANYLLEALCEEMDGTLYLDVSLIDAAAGFRLWSGQFNKPYSDDAFDDLVVDVVRKCEPQLYRSIYDTALSLEGELGANTLYLKAGSLLAIKGWHAQSFNEAIALLKRCVQLKPDFSQATAYLSLLLALGHRVGILEREQSVVDEAIAWADKALAITNQDSTVLGLVGCALCDVGQLHRGEPLLYKATSINPANAQAWAALGAAKLVCKPPNAEEAVKLLQHGVDISPLDSSLAIWRSILAIAHMLAGDIGAAREQAELGCQDDDKTYMPRVVLAAAHLMQKQIEQARADMQEALRIWPALGAKEITFLLGEKLGKPLLNLI